MRSDLAEIRVEFLRSLCSALNLINFRLFDCLTGGWHYLLASFVLVRRQLKNAQWNFL